MRHIACFITPHGFGHATRTIAVLEALRQRSPDIRISLFTTVPEHLFQSSLTDYSYHPVMTDIGLAQLDALHTDVDETIIRLSRLLPFPADLLNNLARQVAGCDCILCDIAPLGIAVAEQAGIPSVLLENFTWDWIYQPYLERHPGLRPYSDLLQEISNRADYHIQTEPICRKTAADLTCPPIFRRAGSSPETIRQRLQVKDRKLVLISLGGIDFQLPQLHRLTDLGDYFFVLAGQQVSKKIADNVLMLARDSDYYHPDLIQAADLVLCKSGYSTVAECCQAGTRIGCISRAIFPESAVLARFVKDRLHGTIIDQEQFLQGSWLSLLPNLLSLPAPPPFSENGADTVATFLLSI